MATIVTPATTVMRPYSHGGPIAYDRLDYNPDEPVLKPDATQQNLQLEALLVLLRAHFTDFNRRPDVFLDFNTILCYDPRDLNVRVSPDVYLAFGVDARAIRSRKLYLPWEAGKPPDWALEIASLSTGGVDTGRKREIYARIGVPEYWRFDPTAAGEYHGTRLAGERLVGGVYRPLPLTREPDGILKGYSPVLRLSLCWDNGWPRLYDPATDTYLETWPEVAAAREAAESQVVVEQAARQIAESRAAREQAAREAAEARIRQLEAELRRRQADR